MVNRHHLISHVSLIDETDCAGTDRSRVGTEIHLDNKEHNTAQCYDETPKIENGFQFLLFPFFSFFLALLHLGSGDLNFHRTVRNYGLRPLYWLVITRIDLRRHENVVMNVQAFLS